MLYRTRLTVGAARGELVNVSPGGFMARCEQDYAVGYGIVVAPPSVGRVGAEVRWALGGRIGCRLRRRLTPGEYHTMRQALPRG